MEHSNFVLPHGKKLQQGMNAAKQCLYIQKNLKNLKREALREKIKLLRKKFKYTGMGMGVPRARGSFSKLKT